jgi:glycosyltransferase involved in cell wall biosynthesis
MSRSKITVCIITLNEEKNIEQCIRSIVDIVDEIIVLDSGSTDSTCNIAKQLGAHIVSHKYLGDGFQKNSAASFARNDWILSLDADERASSELRSFLRNTILCNGFCYSFRRKNHVSNRWIKYGDAYPDRLIRLYQKSTHKYMDVIEHSSIDSTQVVKRNENIMHFGTQSIAEMYEKSIKFAKRSAKKLYFSGAKVKNPFIAGGWLFFRLYIMRFGFLGGMDSFHHCFSAGLRSFYKYSFLREYLTDSKVADDLDGTSLW